MQGQAFISDQQFPGSKEQLLDAMLAAFSEMIYLYDALENRFAFISSNLTEILGYPPDIYQSGTAEIHGLIHPDDYQQITASTIKLFKKHHGSDAVRCNIRIKHANGEYRWFSIRQVIFSRSPEDGRVQYIFGVAVDIHQRKQAEERIRTQRAAISEYVFAASHTVRAPLTNILAVSSLFNDLPEENVDEYRQWAGMLRGQAEKLDEIIHSMIMNISVKSNG